MPPCTIANRAIFGLRIFSEPIRNVLQHVLPLNSTWRQNRKYYCDSHVAGDPRSPRVQIPRFFTWRLPWRKRTSVKHLISCSMLAMWP